MKIVYGIENYKARGPAAVTIGKFDGIHSGHALLTDRITRCSDMTSVMVTFEESPRSVLYEPELKKLITEQERNAYLKKKGIDVLLLLPFDDEMIHMEASAFIEMLVRKVKMKYLTVGDDFKFGYRGKGNVATLEQLSASYGFQLDVVEKLSRDGLVISSTAIRGMIANGQIRKANEFLGHPYFIYGPVVHGNHIGTEIGVPTINLAPPQDKLLPPNGVYVTKVDIEGRIYHGITDVGVKPTISSDSNQIVVETHLLDYSANLYEKFATVIFLEYVREEKKFKNLTELTRQIKEDTRVARAFFEAEKESLATKE
ncbi:riboflavin kinase / FMN adenylyltransferase [Lachnospiraceae bacterium C10]|jgi:riboflavin kinase/FMN adenylyltransferase|nr:riboflavin kinase / FMN adenylyltransferase [Lachnospiraceae bacterium C10]